MPACGGKFRTRQEVHTYSRGDELGGVRPAGDGGRTGWARRIGRLLWRTRADAIRARVESEAWVENGEEGGHYGRQLRKRLSRCEPAADGRIAFFSAPTIRVFLSTFAAVRNSNWRRGDFSCCAMPPRMISGGAPKTAFNVCTFWVIEALHLAGRSDEARRLFETMLSHTTQSGLAERGS